MKTFVSYAPMYKSKLNQLRTIWNIEKSVILWYFVMVKKSQLVQEPWTSLSDFQNKKIKYQSRDGRTAAAVGTSSLTLQVSPLCKGTIRLRQKQKVASWTKIESNSQKKNLYFNHSVIIIMKNLISLTFIFAFHCLHYHLIITIVISLNIYTKYEILCDSLLNKSTKGNSQ